MDKALKTLLLIPLWFALAPSIQIVQQIMTASPPAAVSATPVFIAEASKNSTRTLQVTTQIAGTATCVSFGFCIPGATPVATTGNFGIVAGTFANSTTLTPTDTDDKSDSYTCTTGGSKDTGTNEWPFLCYGANLTSGAFLNTTVFGTTTVTQVSGKSSQWYNVKTSSPLDGTIGSCAGASSSTANCASVTPTVTNDLIYVLVCRAGTPAVTSFTAGAGFTLNTADVGDGCASEWEVDTGTGSLTPSMTMASSSTYIEIVAAFKSQTAGGAPAGEYVERMSSYSTAASFSGSINLQFPSAGNVLVNTNACGTPSGTPLLPTGMTDANNTWKFLGAINGASATLAGTGELWVASAATNTTGVMSEQTTNTGDCTVTLYSIKSAPSPAYAVLQTSSNSFGSGTATVTPGHWYTPAGLVFGVGSQYNNTSISITAPASNCFFTGANWGGESLDGPGNWIDQNNPFNYCTIAAAADTTYTFGQTKSTTAANGYNFDTVDVISRPATYLAGPPVVTTGTSASSLVTTTTTLGANDPLIMIVGSFNSTGRTVSKVCLDGNSTCSTGTQFTQATSAAAASSGNAQDVWYLLAGTTVASHTIRAVYSASASNVETALYEAVGVTAFDLANHSTGTVASNLATGPSLTTTGTIDLCVGSVGVSNAVTFSPAQGNAFVWGGGIFGTTSDAYASSIGTSPQQAKWTDASGTYAITTGCFK